MTAVMGELRGVLGGRLLAAGDEGYDAARRVWNRAVDHRPALIARCADEADVVAAVRFAADRGLPLSVRAGGHDWAGRSLRDGGLVLDLSGMRDVAVTGGVADAAGGARAGDLVAAAARHGAMPVVGTASGVGAAGLTLGGGYGGLVGRYGLALDNLVGARVVLADGRVVDTDDGHEDLLWALCGGGGNFGVATRLRLRVHPHAEVLAGMIGFPLDQAADVLTGLRAFPMPDELSVIAGLFSGPAGVLLALLPLWCGEPAAGWEALRALPALGRPALEQLRAMPLGDVLGIMDGTISDDRHACADSRWLPELTDGAIATMVDAMSAVPSAYSAIAVHHFHGAACRVPADSAAWALRTEHRQVELIGSWTPGDRPAEQRAWVRAVSDALAGDALPGGYPNLLGPDQAGRVGQAFGTHLDRLRAVKRAYDPTGVFRAVAEPPPPEPA